MLLRNGKQLPNVFDRRYDPENVEINQGQGSVKLPLPFYTGEASIVDYLEKFDMLKGAKNWGDDDAARWLPLFLRGPLIYFIKEWMLLQRMILID